MPPNSDTDDMEDEPMLDGQQTFNGPRILPSTSEDDEEEN